MQIEPNYTETYLLPPSIEDWIPEEHPARFIREFVDTIDLKEYGFTERKSKEGRPNYSNKLLLKIWLYSYYEKIYSSRQIERACRNQLPLIWLTTMHYPDHNTLWRFFKKNKGRIKKIFKHTVKIAVLNDMVGFVLQAVDGTKIKADVSKDKVLYGPDLTKLLHIIDKSLEKANKQIEEQEEKGKEIISDKLPKKLSNKKKLQSLIKKGVEELRKEEKHQLKKDLEEGIKTLEKVGRVKLNITDKDSRLIKTKGGKDFYYNVQSVVDSKSQIIVGAKATNIETDNHLLTKMIEEAKTNSGRLAKETLGDAGYFSGEEILKAQENGYSVLVNEPPKLSKKQVGFRKEDFHYNKEKDSYQCPANNELKYSRKHKRKSKNYYIKVYQCKDYKSCQFRVLCSSNKNGRRIERYEFEEALEKQREKQKEKENKELLKKRALIVESVFGWIKHNGNFTRWYYRGLESVEGQWLLLCISVNLRKLYSAWVKNGLTYV